MVEQRARVGHDCETEETDRHVHCSEEGLAVVGDRRLVVKRGSRLPLRWICVCGSGASSPLVVVELPLV